MGYTLACPFCEERVRGLAFSDTDPQLLAHMNLEHAIAKRKKKVPQPEAVRTSVLPDLDIEGLEEPW